jgi:hypothetical protein
MADAIACRWSNGAFFPTDRFVEQTQERFVDGAVYWLNVEPERSEKSHGHEFAWLKEAWKQLPESLADQYPSTEHLRKRALIQGGFYDEQIIDAGSNAAALRVCQGIKAFPGEAFSMVFVRGSFVVVRRAKSQSKKAMGAADFQRSKQAVLEIVSELIGVTIEQLSRAA